MSVVFPQPHTHTQKKSDFIPPTCRVVNAKAQHHKTFYSSQNLCVVRQVLSPTGPSHPISISPPYLRRANCITAH